VALYVPPNIVPADPFDAADISTGFDDLSVVMNATIGDSLTVGGGNINNLRTQLFVENFRVNSLTQLFKSGEMGDETFLFVQDGGGPAIDPIYPDYANAYSTAGVSFFLKDTATVNICSKVDLVAGEGHPFSIPAVTDVIMSIVGKIALDGAAVEIGEVGWTTAIGLPAGIHAGSLSLQTIVTGVSPGYHTAHLGIGLDGSSVTALPVASRTFVQLYGSGASTTVTAFYR